MVLFDLCVTVKIDLILHSAPIKAVHEGIFVVNFLLAI